MILFSGGDINLIKASGLFDEAWYLERYPDVKILGMDPIEHYLWLGERLHRDPSPGFSSSDYLAMHRDVAKSGANALHHYVLHGKTEGRPILQSRLSRDAITRMGRRSDGKKRIAVFASFTATGSITDNILLYLSALTEVCDHIVFVADNDLVDSMLERIKPFTRHIIAERHGEYDFGSYKRGINYASEIGLLQSSDELLLCNDSCYGPIGGFGPMIDAMDKRNLDFWGVTHNTVFQPHIQSYFVMFSRAVFLDPLFKEFFASVEAKKDVSQVVMTYEVPMAAALSRYGFKWDTYINSDAPGYREIAEINPNLTVWPSFLLRNGCPLVKVKAFKKTNCNRDGIVPILEQVKQMDKRVYDAIWQHARPEVFLTAKDIEFSVIVPFFNRKEKLLRAINSVLHQDHPGFELILVNDGSTDDAVREVKTRYVDEINEGKIVIIDQPQRRGVSAARNLGLKASSKNWIAYLDSDNEMKVNFLSTFASLIVEHPNDKVFYSYIRRMPEGKIHGQPYNRKNLLTANNIDLGAFVHAREVYQKNGGFDESLKRLVDWDLIIRYTERNSPVCLNHPMLDYSDDPADRSRISVSESLDDARIAIRLKYKMPFRVTTIIPTYNHEQYIEDAVKSAAAQKGNFIHEILLCDDASTDQTRKVVERLVRQYPGVVKDVSNAANLGISKTFKRCIAKASGDFVAILEGDDVWTDEAKIDKQLKFLVDNRDCSMVFSKILVKQLPSGKTRLLDRQNGLPSKLTGSDFLSDESMNLIANFSSCLFKAGLLRSLPDRLFEGRFNEIALAFYLERHGKIGFLDEVLSTYHQHENGVWTGSSREQQLRSGIETREMVVDVADPQYRGAILDILENRYRKPFLALGSKKAS